MDIIIENSNLKVKANTHGGEMISLIGKKSNQEYIWRGLPFWWKIYCPTLFPVIGKVKGFKYKYDGKEYFMPEHGFASKAKFKLLNKLEDEVAFELKSNEETEGIYPFKFSLITKYKLKDNKVIISFNVNNLDSKDMYFSIGSHPAFKCPMYGAEDSLEDYYIEFEKVENTSKMEINSSDFLTGNRIKYLENSKSINISQETFKDGTIILDNLKSNFIELKSKKHNRSIKVNFEKFKMFSIWAPDKDASFVCLEPWMGHADYENFNGEIKDKEGVIMLKSNEQFNISYYIEINE